MSEAVTNAHLHGRCGNVDPDNRVDARVNRDTVEVQDVTWCEVWSGDFVSACNMRLKLIDKFRHLKFICQRWPPGAWAVFVGECDPIEEQQVKQFTEEQDASAYQAKSERRNHRPSLRRDARDPRPPRHAVASAIAVRWQP